MTLKTDKVPGRRFLDRTCFLPKGLVWVVECKRPKNGRYLAHQPVIIKRLSQLDQYVFTVKNTDEIDMLFRQFGFPDAD